MVNKSVLRSRIFAPLFVALFTGIVSTPLTAEIVGNEKINVELNAERGFRVEAIHVEDVTFPSGGGFPTFLLFNKEGTEKSVPAQSPFFTSTTQEKIPGGLRISYVGDGFSASVSYQLLEGRILVTIVPTLESTWKIRGITDNGSMVTVASNESEAKETGFLLRPYLGGELIGFPENREVITDVQPQSWDYDASFVGIGLRQQGLVLRATQFGAMWTVGSGNIKGIYSLFAGLTVDFRPRRDQPGAYSFWDIALCEKQLEIELIPVGDKTGDQKFTWADIGVDYRRRFIHRNTHLDPYIPGAVMGKIDLSEPYKNPQKYDALIAQLREINYAPQIWWLVGAHTAPNFDFIAPPHSSAPHPEHNGAGGYDYFRFKADASKIGARIGLHEIFDDTSVLNPEEMKRVPLRMQEYGETVGTWSCTLPDGQKFSAVSRALKPVTANGVFLNELKTHFKLWDVKPGDTWHWDVFTSVGGRSDFEPKHPVTHGEDFRIRMELLRQIRGTGVFLTHESLQEALAEYSSYAWVTRAQPFLQSKFAGGRGVPLLPVLFQGTTYYGAPYKPAWGLLMGGNAGWEGTTLPLESIKQGYFGQNTFWAKICDRTVKNMTEIENGWKVEYDQGGSLTVDLKAMTFALDIDGTTYTAENPPKSPYGFGARLVNGTYEIIPPTEEANKAP